MGYQLSQLTNNERSPFTHIAVFDYEGIADNATSSNQVTIAKIPAGGAVEMCGVYVTTALAGASDITLDVGVTAADPDEFIDAMDVDNLDDPAFNTGDAFDAGTATSDTGLTQPVAIQNAATDVLVEWNGTVANLTAGKVVIGLRILDLAQYG